MGEKLKFLQAKIGYYLQGWKFCPSNVPTVGTDPKVKQMLIGQNDNNFVDYRLMKGAVNSM